MESIWYESCKNKFNFLVLTFNKNSGGILTHSWSDPQCMPGVYGSMDKNYVCDLKIDGDKQHLNQDKNRLNLNENQS